NIETWSACNVISATWRCLETPRITWASTGRRRYLRATRATLSSAWDRSAGVGSTWRNVTVICISPSALGQPERPCLHLLAPGRREDAHLLPVLRHGPTRDVDGLLGEEFGDVLVVQRLPPVFLGDDGPDAFLHALGRHLLAVSAAQARREEVLELERALRRVHVLACRRAADRGLVHADVVRDVLQHQRTELRDAVIEEIALELRDARGDHVERALPLVDRLDEPCGRPHLLLDVASRLRRAIVSQHLTVERRDPEARHAVLVGRDDVLVADLLDGDVGGDVAGLALAVVATRLRLEHGDHLGC